MDSTSQEPASQPATRSPSRPRPRPDRSTDEARRVRIQNRRLEYLRRNPAYLTSSDREFVDVALYNSLIRSFQTPAERAAEAQDSGFGHVLEASILRNPEPLQRADEDDIVEVEEEDEEENAAEASKDEGLADEDEEEDNPDLPPRDAARLRWERLVRTWFVGGGADIDDGFDYAAVDDDSDYDTLARADAEAAWFDEESPGWASDEDGETKAKTGETGIQDY